MTDIYLFEDYRKCLRHCLDAARKSKNVHLNDVALSLNVGASYLSRALGNGDSHMSDDLLFELGTCLGLSQDENEFLLLLKSVETTKSEQRKKALQEKKLALKNQFSIGTRNQIQNSVLMEQRTTALSYWMNPLKVLAHAALDLKKIARDPFQLAPLLGISGERLRSLLAELEAEGLVTWNKSRTQILSVAETERHLPRKSLLFSAHQTLLIAMTQAQLLKNNPADNFVLNVTFTASEKTMSEVYGILNSALNEIRKSTQRCPPDRLYQVNVQLFPWL